MKKVAAIIFIILSLFPTLIHAKECDWSEISFEKSLANNISWTLEYYFEKNDIYFDITVSNIYEDLYVKDSKSNQKYKVKEFTLKKVSNNQKLNFQIYSSKCDLLVATKDISLPAYNHYYGTDYCKGIHEFSMCKKWGILSSSITEDVLKIQTDKYRESLAKIDVEEPINYETNITGFYVFTSLIIFALILYVIFILHKKRDKDFV